MSADYFVRCHCERVRGRFVCPDTKKLLAIDCNCSDCFMRRNIHIIIPETDFRLDMEEGLEDATILYQWGTKTAVRRFCKTCGILPWYRPRSNPDGYAITVNCVDWTRGGTEPSPPIPVDHYDGIHWEDSLKAWNDGSRSETIASFSKK